MCQTKQLKNKFLLRPLIGQAVGAEGWRKPLPNSFKGICYLRLGVLEGSVEAVVLEEAGGEFGVAEDGAGDVAPRAALTVVARGLGCGGGRGVVRLAQREEARVLRVEAGVAGP